MTTKDKFLLSTGKNVTTHDNQYSSLNLNKITKCSDALDIKRSQSSEKNFDSVDYENRQNLASENKHFPIKNLRSKISHSLNITDVGEKEDKKRRKKNKLSLNAVNSSTLSLHIAAYENSNEGDTVTIGKNERLKKKVEKLNIIKQWENAKQILLDSTAIILNSFEFPRQQNELRTLEPELTQFKASKKLLNPNESNASPSYLFQHKITNMLSLKHNESSSLETYFNTVEIKPELLVKEKQFEESLKNFYRQKWGCQCRPPVINGKAINLYKLYSKVLSNGGWLKVSNQDKWDDIAQEMGYSENISMINNGIKLIYMRYLSKYEEVQTLGEIDDHDTDIYGSKTKSKMYFNFASGDCPISSLFRDKKIDTYENEYAKVIKSLYSGLPNEVDFAFNVLTVMSNPGTHLFKLEKCPFLLNLMIAHAGVYGDDKEIHSLANGWKTFCDRKFEEFWLNAGIVEEQIYGYIPIFKREANLFKSLSLSAEFDQTNPTCFRILQVTSILRNLSFESINIHTMGKSDILIKFMCICAASKHVRLVNDALNILSNIGTEIDLITPDGVYCNVMLLKIICDCLHSDDKNKVLHSLEIIAALCQNEKNEAVCAEFLDALMINRIFQLATVKDILICIHTLETLYQFSELGRASCNRIISVPNSIELLVSMVTNDAASFGRTGLSGIQVVESLGNQQSARQHYPPPPSTLSTSTYRPQIYPSQPQPPPSTYHQQTPRTVHSIQKIHHPQQNLNVAVTHDDKLKTLTTKWIKENVISESDTISLRGEMYSAYVDHLRTANGIMSYSINSFTQMLQSIFSNSTVYTEQKDNKLNYYIKGVRYLNQSISTVASNYPVMQKILTTPKSVSQTVRIVPALGSPTNGVIAKESSGVVVDKLKPDVSTEPRMNHISNNQMKDVESTVTPTLSETQKDETSEKCNGTMEVDVNNEVFEAEDEMMEEDLNNPTDKIELSSENADEAYSQNDEEQNEIPVVRVEISEADPFIEDSIDLKPKKRINGHILENGDTIIQDEKRTNGIYNGIEPVEIIKENGHIAETSEIDNIGMELDGGLSDHEEEDKNLPEGDPAKIDETVEAVSKVPPKNGKINITETTIVEEVVTNGVKGKKRKASTPKTTKKKTRLAKDSVSADSSNEKNGVTTINEQFASTSSSSDYMCEWNACGHLFSTSEAISIHIIKDHLNDEAKNEDNTFLCLWPACNKTRRAKWSLVTHVGDHHLQEHQLRAACTKRIEMGGNVLYIAAIEQQFAERINEPETVPTYTQAAAIDAIRRHSVVQYQREFTDEQEGPVTKCIRLTTALILRNIARYSEEGRCKLRRFELQLCPIALSRLEANGALIQCLAEMDNTKNEESIPSLYQPPIQSNKIQQQQPQSKPIFAVPLPPSRRPEQ